MTAFAAGSKVVATPPRIRPQRTCSHSVCNRHDQGWVLNQSLAIINQRQGQGWEGDSDTLASLARRLSRWQSATSCCACAADVKRASVRASAALGRAPETAKESPEFSMLSVAMSQAPRSPPSVIRMVVLLDW